MMRRRFWIVARDKPGLLAAMMKSLAGDAHISFEGDLSRIDFTKLAGVSSLETKVLKRSCTSPRLDFVVLPLDPQTISPILQLISPRGAVVHEVIHIQIEKDGLIQFGAYDNFHPECIVAWEGIPDQLLQDLRSRGIIRSFDLAPPAAGDDCS